MGQMGYESSALALEIYAKAMDRKRETGARMDELVRGADWAPMGTSEQIDARVFSPPATKKPRKRLVR